MRKMVYLFELDSVRKTDTEIVIGQKALFDEIVRNGNIVVLTYNQLVDSRGFFSLLDDEGYYEHLIELFKRGFIRISQYGNNRTIVQYLLNTLSQEKSFIYSGWPLQSSQKRLLALIKRCLMYSDMTEINDYMAGKKEEIKALFVEVNGDVVTDTKLETEMCENILENLCAFLGTILRLSAIHTIYVNPKPADEYSMSFDRYLSHALRLTPNAAMNDATKRLWESAREILFAIRKELPEKSRNDRSNYHHALKRCCGAKQSSDADISAFQFAEAIVDLCYNYQLEYSICNVSRHYDIKEFANEYPSAWKTFASDFFSRLAETWSVGNPDDRYLLDETNEFDEFMDVDGQIIKQLERAVRMADYADVERSDASSDDIYGYEYDLDRQQAQQRGRIQTSIRKKIGYALVSFAIALCVEVAYEFLQSYLDEVMSTWIQIDSIAWTIIRCAISVLLVLGVTEYITILIQKRFPSFLPLSDVLKEIGVLVKDRVSIGAVFKAKPTHCNPYDPPLKVTEARRDGLRISYLLTQELKAYLKLQREKRGLFEKTSAYPVADLTNPEEGRAMLADLLKLEETHGYRFGVVYTSQFNTLIVDPIEQPEGSATRFLPYERIVPTSGNGGVVIIPAFQGKFILLRQSRHAIRSNQLAFPRGFVEDKGDLVKNAEREMWEELGAKSIEEPILLGRVAADSGLTSSRTHVYFIRIVSYEFRKGHEGIIGLELLSESEIDGMIENGEIDDGFTLSAWSLYKQSGKL